MVQARKGFLLLFPSLAFAHAVILEWSKTWDLHQTRHLLGQLLKKRSALGASLSSIAPESNSHAEPRSNLLELPFRIFKHILPAYAQLAIIRGFL